MSEHRITLKSIFQKPEPIDEIPIQNEVPTTVPTTQPIFVPIMLNQPIIMNQPGQVMMQSGQQMMPSNVMNQVLPSNVMMTQPSAQPNLQSNLQPNLQFIQPQPAFSAEQGEITNNPSVPGCPSLPPSTPSPVTPTRKIYRQTFFHGDVTLVKEAMKKLTKHVNSASSVRKINANVKFFSEFQLRVTKRKISRFFIFIIQVTLSDPLKVLFDKNVDR